MSAVEPVQQSSVGFFVGALGVPYLAILLLSGMASFFLALLVVLRGKGPMAAASLILIVHTPFLIGLFISLQGILHSYRVIAMSAGTPKPADLAAGISVALVGVLAGMLMMAPGYIAAALGALLRSLLGKRPDAVSTS